MFVFHLKPLDHIRCRFSLGVDAVQQDAHGIGLLILLGCIHVVVSQLADVATHCAIQHHAAIGILDKVGFEDVIQAMKLGLSGINGRRESTHLAIKQLGSEATSGGIQKLRPMLDVAVVVGLQVGGDKCRLDGNVLAVV